MSDTTTQPEITQADREAAHMAAWHVIHGPRGDPFQNPEAYEFCCNVADAILALRPLATSETDHTTSAAPLVEALEVAREELIRWAGTSRAIERIDAALAQFRGEVG